MKILLVSLPSVHAVRWSNQLLGQGWEIYWFDILNRGRGDFHPEIIQIVNWKRNKIPFKGKSFLNKNFSKLYNKIQPLLEITIAEFLNDFIEKKEIEVIHSFEMQSCSYPLLPILLKKEKIRWIYSCWGSDLYFYKDVKNHRIKIKQCLKRIDAIFTDCKRDNHIAQELGFKGKLLGVFPGGGGYNLENENLDKTYDKRNAIIVKGYQNTFGRAYNVLNAFNLAKESLTAFDLIVFSASKNISQIILSIQDKFNSITIYNKTEEISHQNFLDIMGTSFLYIGNSISDGIPNTLLEAMIMGVYPLQSNPGGATQEYLKDGFNGRLIIEPENSEHIALIIDDIIKNKDSLEQAIIHNQSIMRDLERVKVTQEVKKAYNRFITTL